jgi:2-methylcitrate dehydratase PrpD
MAVRGHADFAALDDTAVHDPVIAALRRRVTVTEDPAMTALAPRLRPARVTVELTDGRRASHAVESHRGDFQAPFAEAELRDKFRKLAGTVLTTEGTAVVEQAVDRCDEWDNIGALTVLCRRHGMVDVTVRKSTSPADPHH